MSEIDTVRVPGDARIKQLANDVVFEDNEELVPILRDFYEILSVLNDDEVVKHNEILAQTGESEVNEYLWEEIIAALDDVGLLYQPGAATKYQLNLDE